MAVAMIVERVIVSFDKRPRTFQERSLIVKHSRDSKGAVVAYDLEVMCHLSPFSLSNPAYNFCC